MKLAMSTNAWIDRTQSLALKVLAHCAEDVDRAGRWPAESVTALGEERLLGLTIPVSYGGGGEGPRTFAAVVGLLAEQFASTAMIYLMHVCGIQAILEANGFAERDAVLCACAAGRHLSTLAFSEKVRAPAFAG